MISNRSAVNPDPIWTRLRNEVADIARHEPLLAAQLRSLVLNHVSFESSLADLISSKLAHPLIARRELFDAGLKACESASVIAQSARRDLSAALERDPSCHGLAHPYLHHKGFQALQTYRIAHWFWSTGRRSLASFLQSRASEVFNVDIHPAAQIGSGVFIDHASGVVIGETTVVADDVSMFQNVTLGGTGKDAGDRHPKVDCGVLLCAGAMVLGNVRLGAGAKVGAGSVVLDDVAAYTTVVGVPARPTTAKLDPARTHSAPGVREVLI